MINSPALTIGFMAFFVLFSILMMFQFGISILTIILVIFSLFLLFVVIFATIKGKENEE